MPFSNNIYSVIRPQISGTFFSEWDFCKEELTALRLKSRIFKLNIFLSTTVSEQFRIQKKFIREELGRLFGDKYPATGILPQSPENGYNIVIEAGISNSSSAVVDYRKYEAFPYTVVTQDNHKVLWANSLGVVNPGLGLESCSIEAFEQVREILRIENMSYNNIVRQWNYIGNILQVNRNENDYLQHYQIFNEIRNKYYQKYRTQSKYPAATGIGMNLNGMLIDICAIIPSGNIKINSINNPVQIEPYHYSKDVLVGNTRNEIKSTPLFERAKFIINNQSTRIFVSGTASIIGQLTMGKDDVKKQTKITIQNIETLVSRKNLISHFINANGQYYNQYTCLRVYVKRIEDIPVVKRMCLNHFGNIPATYVQADICREDLLVEIEAELN